MRTVLLTDVLAPICSAAQMKKLEASDFADATIIVGGGGEAEPEEEEPEEEEAEEEEPEEDDLTATGEAADEGDKAAQKELNKLGKAVGLAEADFATWVEFAEAIAEAQEEPEEEEAEEEDEDDDWD